MIPQGICRHAYGRTQGWYVRLYATTDGEQSCTRRFFSDGVHGGTASALGAAVLFRTQELRRLAAAPPLKKRVPGYGYLRRSRVRYVTQNGQERSYDAWQAWFWDGEGRQQGTKWSVERHGEDLARERCEQWLDEKRAGLGEPLQEVG